MSPVRGRLPAILAPLLLGMLLLVALALAASTTVGVAVDRSLTEALRAPDLRDLLAVFRPVTELGSTPAIVVVGAVALAVGVATGQAREAVAGAIVIAATAILNDAFKRAYGRLRPVLEPLLLEPGFAYPSGHASSSAIAYGVLAVLVWRSPAGPMVRRSVVLLCVAVVALVGLSRVWLGVHHPSDVVGGWILGGSLLLAWVAVSRRASPAPGVGAAGAGRGAPRSAPPGAG